MPNKFSGQVTVLPSHFTVFSSQFTVFLSQITVFSIRVEKRVGWMPNVLIIFTSVFARRLSAFSSRCIGFTLVGWMKNVFLEI